MLDIFGNVLAGYDCINNMNVMKANKHTFFLGFLEEDEFWSVAEFSDKNKAQDAFEHYQVAYPNRMVQLIQEIRMHKVLVTHYPKSKTYQYV